MRGTRLLSILLLGLALALGGCQKVEPEGSSPPFVGEERFELTPGLFSDAIPLDYGRLVSAELHHNRPRFALLWFEAPDLTLRAVWVDLQTQRIREGIQVIPRR